MALTLRIKARRRHHSGSDCHRRQLLHLDYLATEIEDEGVSDQNTTKVQPQSDHGKTSTTTDQVVTIESP